MFEPDAESMPAGQRTGLQEEQLRVLADRLLALEAVRVVRWAGESRPSRDSANPGPADTGTRAGRGPR
jgi:hypothetical protein